MPHARAVEGGVGGPKLETRLWLEEIELKEKKLGMTQSFGVEIVFFFFFFRGWGGGREEIADIDVELEPSGSGRQN